MFQLGLRTVVDPERHGPLVEAVLAARSVLHERMEEAKYAGIVEPFERDRYLENATLGENLIFGVPLVPEFEGPALARNALVRRVLREVGLEEELIELAREAWRNLSELFGGCRPTTLSSPTSARFVRRTCRSIGSAWDPATARSS